MNRGTTAKPSLPEAVDHNKFVLTIEVSYDSTSTLFDVLDDAKEIVERCREQGAVEGTLKFRATPNTPYHVERL